jgi:predicted dehydrogenase
LTHLQPSLRSETPLAPLRVGVVGLTPEGLFHLESLALRREFSPVFAEGTEGANVDGIGGCRQLELDELLQVELDLAIIATSSELRIQTSREFLSRGRNVVVEAGIHADEQQFVEECLLIACERNLLFGIWQPELSEPDFLAAKTVAESEDSGEIHSARFLQHCLAQQRISQDSVSTAGRDNRTGHNAITVTRQRLTQLMQLVDEPVLKIHSTIRGNDVASATASTVLVEFESGATGLIDVDVAATTVMDTGWLLQTTHGGYHNGRQSRIEADGEVYDVPVEVEPRDNYLDLARLLRSDTSVCLEYSRRTVNLELSVARLMDVRPA